MSSHSPEAKSSKALRELMSFVLFGFIAILSLAICLKGYALNVNRIEKCLNSYSFIQGVRESAIQYSKDAYERNGLTDENLDDIFLYEDFEEAVESYFGDQLLDSPIYDEESYNEILDRICANFRQALENQLKQEKLTVNDERVNIIVDSLRQCINNGIEINHISTLRSVTNVGGIASSVLIGVCTFFTVAVGLVLFFLGNKRYRSMRAIAISTISASLFDLIFALIMTIIFKIKTIDIYPLYLRGRLDSFISGCVESICIAGGILAVLSVAMLCCTWWIRKNKE